MNIAASQFKQPIEVRSKVSFARFHYGIQTEFQGEVREIRGLSCLVSYLSEGEVKEIQIATDRVRLQDPLIELFWKTILQNDPIERVLGDSDAAEYRKTDALGRGLKGKGHGSIDWKPVHRRRNNGRIWQTYQPWYQWEDETGKHCRYLRKGVDRTVQALIDKGAAVEQILEAIGKSKGQSGGKTR